MGPSSPELSGAPRGAQAGWYRGFAHRREIVPVPERGWTAGSDGQRRYAQDVAREMQYQDLRKHLLQRAHETMKPTKKDDLRRLPKNEMTTTSNSHTAWLLMRFLQRLDVAYGEGSYDKACEILDELMEAKP